MEKEPIVFFNTTGMDPQELARSLRNLLEQGYTYLFNHRGWHYYALNGKAKA